MNKLLLGLGTLSLTAMSVLTIVSCGGSTDSGDGDVTPDPETTTDLKIISTPSTQSTIDKAITDFTATGATESDQIAALQTVFSVITETNFKNFTVKATATSGQVAGTIVLTVNKGFSFGTSSTLTSNLVVDLGITPIRVAQTVITKAIADFKATTTDANKITALLTVFGGITETNFKNFDVTTTTSTITLTAKEGFIFGASKTLSSWSLDENFDLKIIAIPSTQPTIDKAIIDFNTNGATESDKVSALKTIFAGVTTENFKNFDVQATAGTPGTIVLTAKTGYTFNGKATLSSAIAQVVDLNINPTPSTQTVIDKAIKDFNAATIDANKITALSTVFSGITSANFKNFDVTATATSGTTPGTIVLRAKSGFSFGGRPTLISTSTSGPVGPVVDLKITATPSTQTVITKAIADFKAATTDANKITALSTVFGGITSANFNNFTVTATATSGTTPGTITLTAKPGFNFAGNQTLISVSTSGPVGPVVDLKITAKPVVQSVINKAISDIQASGATDPTKITALQTVFNGITTENFPHFDGDFIGTDPSQQIRLTAKPGFNFSGQPTLISISKEVVKLPISRKPVFNQPKIDTATRLISGEGATAASVVGALELVFDGVTIENFKNIKVELSQPGGIRRIILIAKEGYGFSKGETSINSDFVAPDNWMQIKPRPNLQSKINVLVDVYRDVDTAGKPYIKEVWLAALQETFYGVTAKNMDYFIVERPQGTWPNEVMSLKAKPGYLFYNGEERISTQVGRPDTWMAITAKPVHKKLVDDVITVYEMYSPRAQKIKALQTIFNGVTDENFDKFEVTWPSLWPDPVIKLTAVAPWAFDDGSTILNSKSVK